MSQILQTLYASAPVDDMPVQTLELIDPAFNVPGFAPGVIRIVQGYDDLALGLETGETVMFYRFPFSVSLPAKSIKGRQDLTFRVDGVTGEVLKAIEASKEAGNKTQVVFRVYALSDLTHPANPPVTMTAINAQAELNQVTITATFHDLVNKAWPFRRYTPSFAPGLKYYA